MEAIISDISALAYWRNHSYDLAGVFAPRNVEPKRRGVPPVGPLSKAMVDDLAGWRLVDRTDAHLLVTSKNDAHLIQGVTCQVCSSALPTGSLVRALGSYYVVAPELLFIQLASHLSLGELLMVGYEFCGTYRLADEGPVYGLDPLTSVLKLKAYTQRAKRLRGRQKAEQAIQWLADGSGSPAETALAIMFKLPYRHGGYGLGNFRLNQRISLNETGARILGRYSLRPDLFYPEPQHPVEYDGKLYHSSKEQADYDERRRNAYAAMGMAVTVITSRHLCNIDLLDEMAAIVRKNTGSRLNKLPSDYGLRHYNLFNEVCAYWTELKSANPTQEEYVLMASQYSEPKQPW